MKHTGSETVATSIHEVYNFWRVLLVTAGARRVLRVSSLVLAAGLTEGLTIALLLPLLRAIDPASGIEGGSSRLDTLLFPLELRPTLATALIMFVCVAFFRALIVRHAEVAMARLQLDVVRGIRVRLYAAIARAHWLLLRRIRKRTCSQH